jgi:hypothetical protein
MSTSGSRNGEVAPLVVKPKAAWKMLACSNTRGYELLAAGELDSFLDGRSRKIVVDSITRYIARRLAAAPPLPYVQSSRSAPSPADQSTNQSASDVKLLLRPGGRPRKNLAITSAEPGA